jgi:hypothetical protein
VKYEQRKDFRDIWDHILCAQLQRKLTLGWYNYNGPCPECGSGRIQLGIDQRKETLSGEGREVILACQNCFGAWLMLRNNKGRFSGFQEH